MLKMTQKVFFTQLFIITILTIGMIFGLNTTEKLAPDSLFSWICLGFFFFFSLLMFFMGSKAAKSKNKNDFTNAALGFTAGKMFFSMIIIIVYSKLGEPSSKLFVLPFFLVYIIYTAFETYFMMRIGKENA